MAFTIRVVSFLPDRALSAADVANLARIVGVDMEEDLEDLGLLPRQAASRTYDRKDFDRDTVFKAFATLDLVIGGPRRMEMGTGYDVHCPWEHEHTGRATTGAAYVPLLGRFKCHHGHCIDKTIVEVIPRLDEMLREAGHGCLAALDFDVVTPEQLAGLGKHPGGALKAMAFSTARKVAQALAPRQWLARGVLMRGAVTMLFGPPNQGKTLLLTMWAAGMATGAAWGTLKPAKPAKVLTLFAEEDDMEQSRRLTAAALELHATVDEIEPNLSRLICLDVGTMFNLDRGTRALVPTQAWHELVREVQAFRPDVLILDPLIEFHTAEENDNSILKTVIGQFRSLAQRYNLAVVLTHHTRKGDAEAIAGTLDAARGASAIGGAVRLAFSFVEMTEKEATKLGVPVTRRRFYARLDEARNAFSPPAETAEWYEKVPWRLSDGDDTPALRRWTFNAFQTAATPALVQAIAAGCPAAQGAPWSPALRDGELRSIRQLFRQHGIVGRVNEAAALDELMRAGVVEATFTNRHGNRRQGMQAPGELPSAHWIESDDTTVCIPL